MQGRRLLSGEKGLRVSVVVAAFNCQLTIERALNSVLQQTLPVMEVIVVDDASTDQTRSVVRAMAAKDSRIVLLESDVNLGPSGARNLGTRMAAGDWVAVLDADDAWSPERVQVMAETLARVDVDVIADNQLLYDTAAEKVTRFGFSPGRGVRSIRTVDVFEQDVQLGAEFGYGILKPVIRRSFLEAHRLSYNEGVRYGEDMLFLAEMLIKGARAVLIPDALYIYTTRIGDESKVASPHSRSTPRFDLVADGIEALKAKHATAITADDGRAMMRLATRFRQVHAANLAKEERREHGLVAYGLYLARRPEALAQVMRQRTAYARRLASDRLGAVRGAYLPGRAGSAVLSFVFGILLVGAGTLVRALLTGQMQSQSPFLVYVAPVVAGTLVVGPVCGALVIAGSALTGLYFFTGPPGSWGAHPGNVVDLVTFCLVSFSVLLPIAGLRRRLMTQEARKPGSRPEGEAYSRPLSGQASPDGHAPANAQPF